MSFGFRWSCQGCVRSGQSRVGNVATYEKSGTARKRSTRLFERGCCEKHGACREGQIYGSTMFYDTL